MTRLVVARVLLLLAVALGAVDAGVRFAFPRGASPASSAFPAAR